MKINLKYFGMVSEIAKTNEEILDLDNYLSSKDLCNVLEVKYQDLSKIDYRIAINENMSNENIQLKENDTIAILPPFSGG